MLAVDLFFRKSGIGFLGGLCVTTPARSIFDTRRDISFYCASNDRASNFNLNANADAAADCHLHACAYSDH